MNNSPYIDKCESICWNCLGQGSSQFFQVILHAINFEFNWCIYVSFLITDLKIFFGLISFTTCLLVICMPLRKKKH